MRLVRKPPINDTEAGIPLLGDLTVGFQVGSGKLDLGRRSPFCRLPELASDDEQVTERALRQAVNAVIQGTAADLNKMALIRLYQGLDDDCRMLLTVHDSVLLEVPEDRATEVAEQVAEIMAEKPEGFTMPVEVDVRAGGSWQMN